MQKTRIIQMMRQKKFKIKVTDFIISQSTKDIDKYNKKFSSLLQEIMIVKNNLYKD